MLKRRIEVLILAIVGLAILGLAGGFPEAFAISSKNLALTASVKDALSLALSGNSLDLDLTPTPSGVFRTDNFSATVSTTNQTGYTLYVAATGLDHNDTVTANLVHSSPDVLSVIEPLGSVVVVSRSGDTYTDTSSFGNDKWGLSTDATTFKPVSTTNNIFDSYEENTSDRVTNFTFGTKVDTNIVAGTYSNTLTVTAIANPVYRTFTINYDLDGGEGETIQTESIADEYYPEVTITSTVPTKAYHTFLGYATSEADAEEGIVTYQPGDKISMDYEDPTVELYAVWKAYTYTLVYNANNGTGAPNSQTMTYGENTTISATTPTRTGYTFLGWSLSSTVTSATYTANTTYATTTITDAAGITSHNEESATLYAVWGWPTYTNITTGCNATAVGNQFYYNNVAYIKLADSHCWTRWSRGATIFANRNSLCQSGTSTPSIAQVRALFDAYSWGPNLYYTLGYGGDFWMNYSDGSGAYSYSINTGPGYIPVAPTNTRSILCIVL